MSGFGLNGGARRAAALVACLTVAACQSSSDGPSQTSSGGAAATIVGSYSVEGVRIPLPDGEWKLVDTASGNATRSMERDRVILVSETAGAVDRVVVISHFYNRLQIGFMPSPVCDTPNAFHRIDRGNSRGRPQACWVVAPVSLGVSGDAPERNGLLRSYADRRDLYLPVTTLGARFHSADSKVSVDVDYLWASDLLLPHPDGDVWLPDDWATARVEADPAKTAVLDQIVTWAAEWEPRLMPALTN